MADRPILFSGPMVRAILEGRKTQTRRVLKLPKQKTLRGEWEATTIGGPGVCLKDGTPVPERAAIWHTQTGYCMSPGYAPGDRLWVRETWAKVGDEADDIHACPDLRIHAYYRADAVDPERQRWRPSIHMPRWASRLTLTVTDVRVQRLQDISEDDARAEGCPCQTDEELAGMEAHGWFRDLWDGLNKSRGFGWGTNPWVCAVSFSVQKINIDQLEAA
ncbi:hypothetical protein [Paracoccus sp. AK26]|uniref:hypothetical protein n=1 Tax=Paracoccus sp. AK26 TaxID=2589076 RepID=UPI0014281C7E|nr:hypothetical protein [Paracoccus sp. AK26]QIR85038.1 hypothetical protein FIU66_07345 [Paracoccus sp. AK26]